MKKTIKLFLIAGLSLLALSCQKADRNSGEIRFSASAEPSTKTVYGDFEGDYDTPSADILFPLNPSHQAINWISTDQVVIWSDKGFKRYNPDQHYSVYTVTNISEDKKKANLANDGNGLIYDDNYSGDYNFAAFYPPAAELITSLGGATEFPPSGAYYIIPESQTSVGDPVVTEYGPARITTLSPDMSKAFMVASLTGHNESSGPVNLQFYPGFTAFEFILTYGQGGISPKSGSDQPEPMIIKSIKLKTASGLAGKVEPLFNGTAVPFSCSNLKQVVYNFPEGTQIVPNEGLQFTVFAVPRTVNDLSIEVTLGGGQVRTATFYQGEGEGIAPITFDACKKHRLFMVGVPSSFVVYTSEADLHVAEHGSIFTQIDL